MAIFNFNLTKNSFKQINKTTFQEENILERVNLQNALKKQIHIIAPNCLVISEEFSEWEDSRRRIDLLAIDKQANLIVIELKRNETGEHMELQAIRYASMISTLTFSKTIKIYQKYLETIESDENAEENLLSFLEWDEIKEDDFALDIKIILVSSDFSRELTTSVMWLNERNINIKCIRLIPYKFNDDILIDVQQIIPLPEAENYQIKIKQQTTQRREARQTKKDYTSYKFLDQIYNKRKLVLAIIQYFIKDKNINDITTLKSYFSHKTLFIPYQEAQEIYNRQGIQRHFLKNDEIIEFNNEKFAISNQWGVDNINKFIKDIEKIGYTIQIVN
jgi:hypothetical protein